MELCVWKRGRVRYNTGKVDRVHIVSDGKVASIARDHTCRTGGNQRGREDVRKAGISGNYGRDVRKSPVALNCV